MSLRFESFGGVILGLGLRFEVCRCARYTRALSTHLALVFLLLILFESKKSKEGISSPFPKSASQQYNTTKPF
jgi:hypothetical protein